MIKSFKHKGLEQFFIKNDKRRLDSKDLLKITRILDRLDSAVVINDINIPGWNLHELKGDRSGIWSVAFERIGRLLFVLTTVTHTMLI